MDSRSGERQKSFRNMYPVPPGWDHNLWARSYNNANSRIHNAHRNEGTEVRKEKVAEARKSGRTRAIALSIDPPQAQVASQLSQAPSTEQSDGGQDQNCSSSRAQQARQAQRGHQPQRAQRPQQPQPRTMAATFASSPLTFSRHSAFKNGNYPLTEKQNDLCERMSVDDRKRYEQNLASIQSRCKEEHNSDVSKCREHADQVRTALHSFLNVNRTGSWMSYRPMTYFMDMNALFAAKADYKIIMQRAQLELRRHSKDNLCTSVFNEHPAVTELKKQALAMFDQNLSETKITDFFFDEREKILATRSKEECVYDDLIEACETEEEQIRYIRQFSCKPRPDDSGTQTRMRAKWDALWAQGLPYRTISEQMDKDIAESKAEVQRLKDKEMEFKVLSAAKKKKLKRKEQSRIAAQKELLAEHTKPCFGPDCDKMAAPDSIDRSASICNICYQLEKDGRIAKDAVAQFCSSECFDKHLQQAHPCPGSTFGCIESDSGGDHLCERCAYYQSNNWWCSQKCRAHNFDKHSQAEHARLRDELAASLANLDGGALFDALAKFDISKDRYERERRDFNERK